MTLLALIPLDFDPVVEVAGILVRWQAIGVAAAVIVGLLLAAVGARRLRSDRASRTLRPDDLLYLAVAALPGAVLGGRIVHALTFADVYASESAALLDPARGSLSLLGAVVGGALTAGYVARLLDGAAGRWADVAAVPLLVAIGLGKLAQALGGAGQGAPWDGPWATVFVGPGPWVSVEPGVPAHPSQAYEALWAFTGVLLLAVAGGRPIVRGLPAAVRQTGQGLPRRRAGLEPTVGDDLRFGTRFVLAVAWFCLGRILVGFTWREDPIAAGLRGEQLAALVVLGLLALRALLAVVAGPRHGNERRWHLAHRRYRVPD